MKTIEGNKLIAEFMGVKPVDGFYNGWELHKAGLPFSYGAMGNGTSDPKFHSSWDWLMPVVEKVESLGFETSIYHLPQVLNTVKIISGRNDVIGVNRKTKIEATWLAVTEFIKWYNER